LGDLREDIQSLEKSFNLLSQKWSLEMLYTLFLKSSIGFSALKKILGVNSRTLSDKLKMLREYGYIDRTVDTGPPLRVEYALTVKGKNTVLLALPYYIIQAPSKVKLQSDKLCNIDFYPCFFIGRAISVVSLLVSKTIHVRVFSIPLTSLNLSITNFPMESTFSAFSFISRSQSPVIM